MAFVKFHEVLCGTVNIGKNSRLEGMNNYTDYEVYPNRR